MQLYHPDNLEKILSGSQLFVDNDFLNALFKQEEVFRAFTSLASLDLFLYDPLTGFEFLRDIYVPRERSLREDFLRLDVFIQATNHQSVFIKIQENALLLSKIIAHSKLEKPGTVDLLLAGRMMTHSSNHLLITGNLKHFSSEIFDIESRISIGVGQKFFNFGILRFSRKKFDLRFNALKKVDQLS